MLDVGARDGPIGVWATAHRLGVVDLVLVEPDEAEAEALRRDWPKAMVLAVALDRADGTRRLHVTADPARSSLLAPLDPTGAYEVVRTTEVETRPLCDVLDRRVDFVKIDVQGAELDVLNGFGPALDEVVGIEIEVAFDRTYHDQPDVGAVNEYLARSGFVLLDVRPFGDGHASEANAFYARRSLLADERCRFWRALRGIRSNGSMLRHL